MDLGTIEWHDLPLVSLLITDHGVELIVSPYDGEISGYTAYKLTISSFAELQLDFQGTVSGRDVADLEVASFEWKREPGNRISGSIGILPANQGYWTIRFVSAEYTFTPFVISNVPVQIDRRD